MRLPFLRMKLCRVVHVSLVNVGCLEVLGGPLCSLFFQTRVCCLVCVVRM